MLAYYEAYYRHQSGEAVMEILEKAEQMSPDYCFPNKLEDIAVLRFAVENGCAAKAGYYLGNLSMISGVERSIGSVGNFCKSR